MAVYRIFFERKNKKKNCVWLLGERNSGKSTFIELLAEIFCTQEFEFIRQWCPIYPPNKDWEVQVSTSKEFDAICAFSGDNFATLKRMWEGIGAQVSSNKGAPYKAQFKDHKFIVASNIAPACARIGHKDYNSNYLPMEERFEMVQMKERHEGTTIFPYDATILAGALQQLVKDCPSDQQEQIPEERKEEEV